MKIETLAEWNAVAEGCGCCPMPGFPAPESICEAITGSSEIGSAFTEIIIPLVESRFWQRKRTDYSAGGFKENFAPAIHWTTLGGVVLEPVNVANTSGGDESGTATVTKSLEVLPDVSRAAGLAAIMAEDLDWGGGMTKFPLCESELRHYPNPVAFLTQTLYVVFGRFRWVVSSEHTGKFFKITWRIVTESVEYAAWKSEAEAYISALAEHLRWEDDTATFEDRLAEWTEKSEVQALWVERSEALALWNDLTEEYQAWLAAGSLGEPPEAPGEKPPEPGDSVLPGDEPLPPGDEPEIPPHPGASPEPAPTLETYTWEWVGPGDTEDPGGTSWVSPWFYLGLPDYPSKRRVVNIRYEGYRSARTGTAPQLMGEGYEIPTLPAP